jgi:hypothetical protein
MTPALLQLYKCQNPDCRAEVEITDASAEATMPPTCSCGAQMKKVYTATVLKELNGHPTFTWVKTKKKHA